MNFDLSHHLRSKTGKSLFHVFGMTKSVKDFDHHHCLFKDFRYANSAEICNRLQNTFKCDIKAKLRETIDILSEWEKHFFSQHGYEARITDMDATILKYYNCKTHAKSLIKSWKL